MSEPLIITYKGTRETRSHIKGKLRKGEETVQNQNHIAFKALRLVRSLTKEDLNAPFNYLLSLSGIREHLGTYIPAAKK
jgi:hypothetical protein